MGDTHWLLYVAFFFHGLLYVAPMGLGGIMVGAGVMMCRLFFHGLYGYYCRQGLYPWLLYVASFFQGLRPWLFYVAPMGLGGIIADAVKLFDFDFEKSKIDE